MSFERQQLRQLMRDLRQQKSLAQQQAAMQALLRFCEENSIFNDAQRIAFYVADDGEIDPQAMLVHFQQAGKQCFMPVLREKQLLFASVAENTEWRDNRYGIAEPKVADSELLSASQLDLIFMPLVSFDRMGHRLGRGAGYYDRSLAKLMPEDKVRLVGLAHSVQEVGLVKTEEWDVDMDAVLTEKDYIECVKRVTE